jgi:hypothetical protein
LFSYGPSYPLIIKFWRRKAVRRQLQTEVAALVLSSIRTRSFHAATLLSPDSLFFCGVEPYPLCSPHCQSSGKEFFILGATLADDAGSRHWRQRQVKAAKFDMPAVTCTGISVPQPTTYGAKRKREGGRGGSKGRTYVDERFLIASR